MSGTGLSIGAPLATSAGVYFRSNRDLYRIAPGAAPALVLSGVGGMAYTAAGPTRLVWDGTLDNVKGVLSIALSDAHPTVVKGLDDTDGTLWYVAASSDHVFAWDFFNSSLSSAPIAGGTPKLLATIDNLSTLVLDGAYLYAVHPAASVFSGDETVRISVTEGNPETVYTAPGSVAGFALDAASYYFADGAGISRVRRTDTSQTKRLLLFPSTAGGGNAVSATPLVQVDNVIFYVSGDNDVGWVRTDGSDCGLVVSSFTTTNGVGASVSADAQYVYLVDGPAGALYRIARSGIGL